MFLHVDSEDSDQTGRMPRLILVYAGRTGHFVGFVVLQLINKANKSEGYQKSGQTMRINHNRTLRDGW